MSDKKYEIVKFIDNQFELDVYVNPNEETIWLTQNEIAELFDKDRKTITRHIQNIIKELIKEGFDKRALYNDIEETDTQLLVGEALNTETLHKLAINFSDAVICASDTISEELERYIKDKNISYLPYTEENTHENYWDFFTEIYPALKEEND